MSVPHTKKQFQFISGNSHSVYKETTSNNIRNQMIQLKQSKNDDMKKIFEEVLKLDMLVDQIFGKNP